MSRSTSASARPSSMPSAITERRALPCCEAQRRYRPLHDRHTALSVRGGLGLRFELMEVGRRQPEVEYSVADATKRIVAGGIAEVREAREYPMQPLPFVIDGPRRAGTTELRPTREQRANARRRADLLAQCRQPR